MKNNYFYNESEQEFAIVTSGKADDPTPEEPEDPKEDSIENPHTGGSGNQGGDK